MSQLKLLGTKERKKIIVNPIVLDSRTSNKRNDALFPRADAIYFACQQVTITRIIRKLLEPHGLI